MSAMTTALAMVAAAIVMTMAGSAMAHCPAGSYPALDNWGNRICKKFGSGETMSVSPGPGGGCPNGTYPALDNRGNAVCQERGPGGRTYYDSSKGCPIGTYPALDSWGNSICRSF